MASISPQQNGWNHLLEYWPRRRADQSSGPFWWTYATVFTVMAALLFLGALIVLVVKLEIKPELPRISVDSARLDVLRYEPNQGGLRDVKLTIGAAVENPNTRTDLSFSDLLFNLTFADRVLLRLASHPFVVPRKSSHLMNYTARATNVGPLGGGMEEALSNGLVPFTLAGEARTYWKEGSVVAFRTWTRLFCNLSFYWPSGTAHDISCSTKTRL
jgi:hypothetical protein